MKDLYINSTVRDNSRTAMLAEHLLERLGGDTEEVRLIDTVFPKTDSSFLAKRDAACASGDYTDGMFGLAKQFAAADRIIIAAPYWDLSFPSTLKQYFEQINVLGITFIYGSDGIPRGLCRAKVMFYVTTAGGRIFSDEYGFGYVKALAENFYHIDNCVCFKAEELDIYGADTDEILRRAKNDIDRFFD